MQKYTFILTSLFFISIGLCKGQSLEFMLGHERLFADVQWLKSINGSKSWSVFSRTRATVDDGDQTNLFSGAYLNYTRPSGLGASLVGKIASSGSGGDAGLHLFKAKSKWMLFGLASIGLKDQLEYSWFSILRYTPRINDHWKLYTSLELFNLIGGSGHLFSVQRVRVGLDYRQLQFGIAGNFSESGSDWDADSNLGVFLRKSF